MLVSICLNYKLIVYFVSSIRQLRIFESMLVIETTLINQNNSSLRCLRPSYIATSYIHYFLITYEGMTLPYTKPFNCLWSLLISVLEFIWNKINLKLTQIETALTMRHFAVSISGVRLPSPNPVLHFTTFATAAVFPCPTHSRMFHVAMTGLLHLLQTEISYQGYVKQTKKSVKKKWCTQMN